jgi:hypothetical protein
MLKSKSFLYENDFFYSFKVFKISLFTDGCLCDLLRLIDYLPRTQAAVREEVTVGYSFLTAGDSPESRSIE